jgi:hypothetical protein
VGNRKVNYKLRDWLFARQRYWGEPFPLLYPEGSDTPGGWARGPGCSVCHTPCWLLVGCGSCRRAEGAHAHAPPSTGACLDQRLRQMHTGALDRRSPRSLLAMQTQRHSSLPPHANAGA